MLLKGEYGGSVQILPIQPRLKDIAQKMLPILEQTYGSYENCARHGFGLGRHTFIVTISKK